MKLFLVLSLYNILLPFVFIIGFPAWLIKMLKRGGYGSGLLQRFGIFKEEIDYEPTGRVYIHAISVGEVMIALKLIHQWKKYHPDKTFLLVPTTATGHAVATERAPSYVHVIYSPLDFPHIIRRILHRFEPSQIVLIEAEAWPNLLYQAHKMNIPTSMVNARISPRSQRRFLKLRPLVSPIFSLLHQVCVQDEGDMKIWAQLGLPKSHIHHTGSIKFDPSEAGVPKPSEEFSSMLEHFGKRRKIIMALSTHEGEEAWIAQVIRTHFPETLFVPVPRHFERTDEIHRELSKLGYEVVLRSEFAPPKSPANACFLINSTGELKTWTAHADIAIIGKSILGKGGQNPTEAIAASVPILSGPSMENFQTLVDSLRSRNAIRTIRTPDELKTALEDMLRTHQTIPIQEALKTLEIHAGATQRSIKLLENIKLL